ncbi:metallophosphoesterase [Chlorobium phaeovibrioides]|uniref:Metallophosphoesterase n=1 Tax=Chlorobium phaeovibrioides TaxID=1094 RepID=A0ABW9UPM9_CHLPH|nr:metallophosphoesterase [Chlorobium phaeovibrioides]MWV53887.1 metallophosphoesterase [Chlorobium phaeovibrioides]QEQ56595.1 metallophosphoesterase [Chlorobium phaeovibrioides]RTY35236.1 metallophosphoesterase [Chlorobium phaeovibrioides]
MKHDVHIAHISDLHIAGSGEGRQLQDLDRMLEYLNVSGYDHLVISGDLSDRGRTEDWAIVKDKLVRHGWYHWERTTVVAGNHDLIRLEEEMRFYNAMNPLQGLRERACRQRAESFCRFFRELVTAGDDTEPAFPFIKVMRFPAATLSIVACNSVHAWSPTDNPLGARGVIDPSELRAIASPAVRKALSGSFVIGLCHHALKVYGTDRLLDQAFDWTMELKNRDDFLQVMREIDARVVLHGHFHRFQTYTSGGIEFINGGSFRYASKRFSALWIAEDGSFTQEFSDIPL